MSCIKKTLKKMNLLSEALKTITYFLKFTFLLKFTMNVLDPLVLIAARIVIPCIRGYIRRSTRSSAVMRL